MIKKRLKKDDKQDIIKNKFKLGVYKHFKGSKYKVLSIVKNSETKEELIVYQELDSKDKIIWARPKRIFTELVEQDGKKIPRFKFLSELSEDENFEHKYKRALADYQNLLKRTAVERQDFVKYANEQLLHEILPVYDNLKISLEHADENVDKNGWLKGIEYVVKQFSDVLKNLGVEEIKTVGEKFNPELMEAIEGNGDKVKQEVKAGYKLNGKIIAPAKVILE